MVFVGPAGEKLLDESAGYDANTEPGVSTEFSTAAFRVVFYAEIIVKLCQVQYAITSYIRKGTEL